ncbi:hypothetical protein ANO11243_011990 [Dothideomycetidae sp. 11243]|nr:hypothetical protein ANO11243_011990 [fungal sp. No.11243]
MSAWPQQQNGVFPGMLDASNQQNTFDPSMSQMYGGSGALTPTQFTNPQMQQRMPPNGGIHPQVPFPNQTFNVGQVVPSKRSSDGMAMSPGPAQNTSLNASRSQTPMQPNTPFQGGQSGQQYPNPYQHLQQQGNSADASPSPTIQNQQFRPPQPPQRMTTQSPASFNQMSGQMSPTAATPQQQQPQQTQQHSVTMSPQAQQQSFSPNLAGGQGFGQQFAAQNMMQPGMPGVMNNMNAANVNMTAQMQAQLQQRQFQQRYLQQQQRLQASAMLGGRQMPGQMGVSMGAQMAGQMGQQFPNQHMAQSQQSQQGQQGQQQTNPQAVAAEKARLWLTSLQASLQVQGKPFNANPNIAGRPVNLYMIWACVAQSGGSARINAANAWGSVAGKLGFPNNPTAAQELKNAFDMYVSNYEQQALQRQAQRNAATAQMNARQVAGMTPGGQGSPTRPTQSNAPDAQQSQFVNPTQQGHQNQSQQPHMQQMGLQNQLQQQQQQPTNALQRPGSHQMTQQYPPQQNRQASLPRQESIPPQAQPEVSPAPVAKTNAKVSDLQYDSPEPENEEYICQMRDLNQTHGGYPVDAVFHNSRDIAIISQDSVRAQTMSLADVKALTLSLESGIPNEVRYAIDTIADLSSKTVYWREGHGRQPTPGVIILDKCEDLLDAMLDCVEEHLEILADGSESSEGVSLPSYEDLLRLVRADQDYLRSIYDAGTKDYQMLNAADRLVAVLGILSNLSMDQFNHPALAASSVVSLFSDTIRHIGSRKLYLRSHENTLDFYKIGINFLSNVAGAKVELGSQDEALNFLNFILAFGPQPPPSLQPGQVAQFIGYNPAIHRYLPAAVDALAKLLARQEPNRSHFRSIFSTTTSVSDAVAPINLLTRAFAMAVSFLPDRTKGPLLFEAEINLLKLRKAYLAQGMLAADILTSMIPTNSSVGGEALNVARAWLEADSRWPASLVRMAFLLSTSPKVNENLLELQHRPLRRDHVGQIMRDRNNMALFDETNDVPGMTANRALRMLLRLVEAAMARSPEESESEIFVPGDPIPKRETITALLGTPQSVDTEAIRTMDKLYDLVTPKS